MLDGKVAGKELSVPEQVMKCCRKISPEIMTNFVNSALQEQFNALPKNVQQHLKKSGILIIDFHQDCYYGDKDNPHVRKSKLKKSTNLFYEYLTADIYCKYGCFTIAIFHRMLGDDIFTLVKRVLKCVEKTINLKIVIFDGLKPSLKGLKKESVKLINEKEKTLNLKSKELDSEKKKRIKDVNTEIKALQKTLTDLKKASST